MDHEDCYGQFDPETIAISIDSTLTLAHQEEVFWHEVVEAIDCLYELELEHHKIQTLGVALHQVSLSSRPLPPDAVLSLLGVPPLL